MLRRYFHFILLGAALLLFTPAHSEVSFSASSSLDSFSYDLDNIHIKLEKLNARWQLSPFDAKKLHVEQLKAKRLTITISDNTHKSGESALPDRINLPFPIRVSQAEIAEIVIISADEQHILKNVQFTFKGDAKTLDLKLIRANTPWGEANASANLSTAKPFPLTGVAALKQTSGNTPYDVNILLSGNLENLNFESAGILALQDGKLNIQKKHSTISQPIAHFSTKGTLGLTEDYPITANVRITEMRPERMGDYPTALINADIDLQGKLQPTIASTLKFVAYDSQWQNQAIAATGNLLIAGTRIQQLDVQANVGSNHFQAHGNIGNPDSLLEWQAEIPNLGAFGKDYAGEIHANGALEGALDHLALQFNLLAQQLQLPNDLKIQKLAGQATLAAGEHGKFEGDFKVSAMQYGQHPSINSSIVLQGTRAQHQLSITAQGDGIQFTSQLQGGLSANNLWQGFLQQLNYAGSTPIKLTAPAALQFDKNSFKLEHAALQLNQGHGNLDLLHINRSKLSTKGHLAQLTLKDVPHDLLTLPESLEGDAAFSANWDINAGDTINGNFSIWHESGDFSVSTLHDIAKPLGLTEAILEVAIIDNHANVSTKFDGKNLGKLKANLTTNLTRTDAGFALLANSPLSLDGTAQLHTLSWLPLFPTLKDVSIDGELSMLVKADGTLGKPSLIGNVSGKNLSFNLESEGVALRNGLFEAEFQQDALHIKQAAWQGGEGSLHTDGVVTFIDGKLNVNLNWTAKTFTILSRTDRLLTLSGLGKTTLANDILTISGDFTVNKGLVQLPKEDAPALGDDVIILGQSTTHKEPSLQILLNGLHIDLGKDFTLRGRGLDAELTGALTLTGLTQYHPYTQGAIKVKTGTYLAYGQTLTIERGILNFSGPIDNPGLNIRAMRNSKPVNAGIEITGSAFLPITKLVSDPNVADSEKLSWLVLGHGMEQAGKNDYSMLSLAAGVLLSQGQSVPLQTQLARAAGLDEFSFSGGDAESAALTFGKRLTSQLYLSYEKSISGLLDVARLTFSITPRWSLRAQAGTESAVDVLYTFSFK